MKSYVTKWRNIYVCTFILNILYSTIKNTLYVYKKYTVCSMKTYLFYDTP